MTFRGVRSVRKPLSRQVPPGHVISTRANRPARLSAVSIGEAADGRHVNFTGCVGRERRDPSVEGREGGRGRPAILTARSRSRQMDGATEDGGAASIRYTRAGNDPEIFPDARFPENRRAAATPYC